MASSSSTGGALGAKNYQSKSHTSSQNTAKAKINLYVQARGLEEWDKLSEAERCNEELYGDFACDSETGRSAHLWVIDVDMVGT